MARQWSPEERRRRIAALAKGAGRNTTMLERLKNVNLDGMDIDEAVALSAFARGLKAEYDTLSLETPEWLDTRIRELRREIKRRSQDAIARRLAEAKARREALKPATEKREELDKEIAMLEQLVGTE